MGRKLWFFALAAVLVSVMCASAQEQEEEGVRGSFLTSRPVPSNSNKPATSSARKPPRVNTTKPRPKPKQSGTNTSASTGLKLGSGDPESTAGSARVDVSTGPIGLGYSLFLKDKDGALVRVDPSREFHYKDSIRLSLESNTDGYLYVFYTENDNSPQMLFPDARLVGGDNAIEAHVPYEVPSSHETDPSRRWFVFDNNPAVERLYIVVSRRPLPVIPTGDDLIAYCNGRRDCTWKVTDSAWSMVKNGLNAQVRTSATRNFGQAQTDTEREATTRSLGLDTTAPAPTVVKMNVSANAPILITRVELTHK
jgi:hypothetical protein